MKGTHGVQDRSESLPAKCVISPALLRCRRGTKRIFKVRLREKEIRGA
jgi:hypothetical protein